LPATPAKRSIKQEEDGTGSHALPVDVLRLDFDRRLKLQFRGSVVTSDAGVDRATFKAWTARLDAVHNFEEPPPSSAEIMRKPLIEREHELRVIAERMFEGY
jgi:hypothetical protein